jgi:Leucine-rich repeat (LRR) protein
MIKAVPSEISALEQLEWLSLSNNNLLTLGTEIHNLPSLKGKGRYWSCTLAL